MTNVAEGVSARNHANPSAPAYRVPPNNIELELALLGAILVNNEAYYHVANSAVSETFCGVGGRGTR
jgi:hypothetical protein